MKLGSLFLIMMVFPGFSSAQIEDEVFESTQTKVLARPDYAKESPRDFTKEPFVFNPGDYIVDEYGYRYSINQEKFRELKQQINYKYDKKRYHYIGTQGKAYVPLCAELVERYIQESSELAHALTKSMMRTPDQAPATSYNHHSSGYSSGYSSSESGRYVGGVWLPDHPRGWVSHKGSPDFDKDHTGYPSSYSRSYSSSSSNNSYGCFTEKTKLEVLFVPLNSDVIEEYRMSVDYESEGQSAKTEWFRRALDFGSLNRITEEYKDSHHLFILSSTEDVVDDPRYVTDCWSSLRAIVTHPIQKGDPLQEVQILNPFKKGTQKDYLFYVTPMHNFKTQNHEGVQAWTKAMDLGPHLALVQGWERYSIVRNRALRSSKDQNVYNLTVGTHVYYVGTKDGNFLVHNVK